MNYNVAILGSTGSIGYSTLLSLKNRKNYKIELNKIERAAKLGFNLGLDVHAGHGLTYESAKILSKTKHITEFNIGHFIIGESIFYGLPFVIKKFKRIIKKMYFYKS